MNFRIVSVLLASIAAAPALAQTAAPDGPSKADDAEDIIVTAQRRNQALLEVPIAVSALSGDTLRQRGITTSADLQIAVPNLQVSSAFGQTQPNFSLRGVSVANEYNANQASPIGVYVDDVYLANRAAHGMGLFDLDRVEVLRGPQGTLFGRNTTGGTINFITIQPGLASNRGYAEAGHGNFATFSAQAAAEITLAKDAAGLRIAGNYVKGDGQIENIAPEGRDGNSRDTLQGRATLRFKTQDGALDFRVTVYGGRDRGTQAAIHGPRSYRDGLDFFQVNENRMGLSKTEAHGVSATISWDLTPHLGITSITSRDWGSQNLQQAADGSPSDVLDVTWRSQYSQFSEELRANYENGRLSLVAGGFYGFDRVITDNSFNIGSAIAPGINGGFFQHYRQTRRSFALFAQGDYALSNRLSLTLGTRYTWDRAQYRDGFAYLFAGDVGAAQIPLATTVPCPTAPGSCAYDPTARFVLDGRNNALTGRAALSYTLNDGTLLYVSYNRGYRSGAFNGGGYPSSAGINFVAPERVDAYEIGAKGRYFDDRLTLSAAAFHYLYKNQQVQDTRPGPVSFLVNAPKAEIFGAEIETRMKLSRDFTITAAAGYLHSRYKELLLQGTDLSGHDLPFTPRLNSQVAAEWTLLRSGVDQIIFSPNVALVSRQFFSPFNATNAAGSTQINGELQQPGYAKVNASLTWTHARYLVRLWATNIFDRQVYGYGIDTRGAGFPYSLLVPSTPRTWGASIRIDF